MTVMRRSSNVPAVSWAARIITSGIATSGARSSGRAGKGRRSTSVDTAVTFDAAASGRRAGGVTKMSTTIGTIISQAMDPLCEWPP